jgi:quinolinate synthase
MWCGSADAATIKQITLPKLRDLQPEVEVEPQIAAQARRAIERMLAIRG